VFPVHNEKLAKSEEHQNEWENFNMNDAERAQGIMTGISVGNLLGITVEGWSRGAIRHRHPEGMREIVASSGYPDDDDLAQSIIVAEAAAEGPLDVDDLGRRFWVWGEENGAGMGGLTGRALTLYGGSYPQRLERNRSPGMAREPHGLSAAQASRQAWQGYSAGNGALMRCAPLAIRWRHDPVRLVRESIVSAVPTHWDPRCGWSCALYNLAIAATFRNETPTPDALIGLAKDGVEQALDELRHYEYEPEPPEIVVTMLHEASRSSLDDLTFDGGNMGYTLLSMQAGMIAFWRAPSFEAGVRETVEAGGDTDTNGAIVGAIIGARFGLEGIPPRWRRSVAAVRTGRVSMEILAGKLT